MSLEVETEPVYGPGLRVVSSTGLGRLYEVPPNQEVVIGRKDSEIVIEESEISRRHAKITWKNGLPHIEDLGSTNGTRVRDKLLDQAEPIYPGDIIQLGATTLTWVGSSDQPLETTQRRRSRRVLERDVFFVEIEKALQENDSLHLAVLNLNNIIGINNRHGEETGDLALEHLRGWIKTSYPIDSKVRFGHIRGPHFGIMDHHPLASKYLSNIGELISSGQVPVFFRREETIELEISLGIAKASGKNSSADLLVKRVINISDRASRSERRVLLEDLAKATLAETTASLRIFLDEMQFVQSIKEGSHYHQVLALTLGNPTEWQRQFGLATTSKWNHDLGSAVLHEAPGSCILAKMDGWYFVATKDQRQLTELAKSIEGRWQIEAGNPLLELVWAADSCSSLGKVRNPLDHLVSEALANQAHVVRTPTLPFPYAGLRHLHRTRLTSRGRLGSHLDAFEMALRFLTASFHGVLAYQDPNEAKQILNVHSKRPISMGSWFEMTIKLAHKLVGDVTQETRDRWDLGSTGTHLRRAALQLIELNKAIDLQSVVALRNGLVHTTQKVETTYESDETVVESTLSELDRLFEDSFSDYQLIAVVDSVWDGNEHLHTVKLLDGDNENFPLDKLSSDTPLVSKWCYLRSKENQFFSMVPFFFLADCETCQRPEIFSVSNLNQANQITGSGVVTGHTHRCKLPANYA